MAVNRSYTWIDENIEHTDSDEARAKALAKKWSELMTADENRRFRFQAAVENYEMPECECDNCLTGEGECEMFQAIRERQAESDLEIELIEDKLALLGARMMRPYEHWNEDEAYMSYMENRSEY